MFHVEYLQIIPGYRNGKQQTASRTQALCRRQAVVARPGWGLALFCSNVHWENMSQYRHLNNPIPPQIQHFCPGRCPEHILMSDHRTSLFCRWCLYNKWRWRFQSDFMSRNTETVIKKLKTWRDQENKKNLLLIQTIHHHVHKSDSGLSVCTLWYLS